MGIVFRCLGARGSCLLGDDYPPSLYRFDFWLNLLLTESAIHLSAEIRTSKLQPLSWQPR